MHNLMVSSHNNIICPWMLLSLEIGIWVFCFVLFCFYRWETFDKVGIMVVRTCYDLLSQEHLAQQFSTTERWPRKAGVWTWQPHWHHHCRMKLPLVPWFLGGTLELNWEVATAERHVAHVTLCRQVSNCCCGSFQFSCNVPPENKGAQGSSTWW